jgi:hypothetical protein
MTQMEYWDNRDAYSLKHSNDKVCINCKHCKETSAFIQCQSIKKCNIDQSFIKKPCSDSCPAFEF